MRNHNWKLEIVNWKLRKRGFSLVELMVTVAIIATVSVSAYVGLGAFRESFVVQQSAELLKDILDTVEQEVVRGEIQNATIWFNEDYIKIYAEPADTGLNLDFAACTGGKIGVATTDVGELRKKNEEYTIRIMNINADSVCDDFMGSSDLKWEWQMFYNGEVSPIIRFIHYNPKRETTSDLQITNDDSGHGSRIVIKGPYVSKTYYDSGDSQQTSLTLTLTDGDNEETFTLN